MTKKKLAERYSLWLKPEGEIVSKLRALITKLADEYGGPKFEPHVTLLGDINLSKDRAFAKAFQVSTKFKPFTIELNDLGYTENYFRCVFVKAKKTEFLKDISMPHMSLVYGNLDEKLKKKIIKQLGSLNFKLKIKSIFLTNSSSTNNPDPNNWKVLAEFPFEIIDSLKKGKIGVIPTDTIYGIVGSALNKKTVKKIYKLRKRLRSKPFIILISKLDDLKKFDINLTKDQTICLKKIWPNPVSVSLQNVAFRIPKDKWLLNLLEKVGPLVAPSANFEGEKVSENIEQAKKYFGDNISFYIDGGEIKSKPSTIIELGQDGKFKVLRQGTYRV